MENTININKTKKVEIKVISKLKQKNGHNVIVKKTKKRKKRKRIICRTVLFISDSSDNEI